MCVEVYKEREGLVKSEEGVECEKEEREREKERERERGKTKVNCTVMNVIMFCKSHLLLLSTTT